ncbi:MAG: thioredoxin fold domain-containing protein [Anaerolineae bacterium]|nr:thioredoxin fold domain-containing protein [Anaerolineae bacterium]
MRSFSFVIVLMTLSGLGLIGCSTNQQTPAQPTTPATQSQPTLSAEQNQGLQVLLANSRNLVGENRFPIGVIRNGKSVQNAQVHLRFFDINGDEPVLKNESNAPYYGDNLGAAGVYVGRATIDKAGEWGVEATVTEPGFAPESKRIAFTVLEKDPSPAVGAPAPPTKIQTLNDVNGDRTKICSGLEEERELHRLSIDQAVASGKPTVILFATPRFCHTRTCGPNLQVVQSLAQNYNERVNFIHVEVYKNFETFEVVDAMREWNLETEPWLVFVDANGKIVRKYEGGITSKEIVPDFVSFIGG